MTIGKSTSRVMTTILAVGLATTAALVAPSAAGAVSTATAVSAVSAVSAGERSGPRTGGAATPVGTWEGTVQHAEGLGGVTLSFHRNGVLCLRSGDGGEGGGEGRGRWHATGGNTLSYQVTERLYDGTDTTVGFVRVDQRGMQRALTIKSDGLSKIYDATGTLLATAPAHVEVRRISAVPESC
ncbi:hypothetical protein KQY30_18325 [Streptomyces sp. GMY02]|uniref:hypothetical protein n=1 Tax=Streptomyces sp. GMY02 TaxID=1333528 RepID=UPI001C2BF91A|nr:hypothetical protein [Streptomyces sp. GMY02]QXE35929.1 hypothetical protein KQY30_18325 [Streptomyces sp. GMY02]